MLDYTVVTGLVWSQRKRMEFKVIIEILKSVLKHTGSQSKEGNRCDVVKSTSRVLHSLDFIIRFLDSVGKKKVTVTKA